MSKWKPPPEGWVKLNVDGAFSAAIGAASIGVIVRDWKGEILSAWRVINHGVEAEEIEALAGWHARKD